MNFFVYFMHFVLCTIFYCTSMCDWHAFNKCNLLACSSSSSSAQHLHNKITSTIEPSNKRVCH